MLTGLYMPYQEIEEELQGLILKLYKSTRSYSRIVFLYILN